MFLFRKKKSSTPDQITLSLHTLPVELVYKILDKLHYLEILLSCRDVCSRLNAIIDSYHRYKVIIDSFITLYPVIGIQKISKTETFFESIHSQYFECLSFTTTLWGHYFLQQLFYLRQKNLEIKIRAIVCHQLSLKRSIEHYTFHLKEETSSTRQYQWMSCLNQANDRHIIFK